MNVDAKIKPLDELAAGQTVVHCHGVFDLLHIGHIRYFSQTKESATGRWRHAQHITESKKYFNYAAAA